MLASSPSDLFSVVAPAPCNCAEQGKVRLRSALCSLETFANRFAVAHADLQTDQPLARVSDKAVGQRGWRGEASRRTSGPTDDAEASLDATKFACRVRRRLGFRQTEFADRIGVSIDTIRYPQAAASLHQRHIEDLAGQGGTGGDQADRITCAEHGGRVVPTDPPDARLNNSSGALERLQVTEGVHVGAPGSLQPQ